MTRAHRRPQLRTLDDDDRAAVWHLLGQDPISNVFVAARVENYGLDSWRLGCPIWGWFVDGELVSLCHSGSNLVPVNATDEALDAFVAATHGLRRCSSIIGAAPIALKLWRRLTRRWGDAFGRVREVRASQPMMAIWDAPTVDADPRVRRITLHDLDSYFDAAVQMYTEEVGVSPLTGAPNEPYKDYVRRLIQDGRAFGIVDEGRVIYKSDIGAAAQGVGQVQGVWLDPVLRGRGIAPAAMAAVVELAREEFDTISLYVNDFNRPARATYERVGFEQVGEFATILY